MLKSIFLSLWTLLVVASWAWALPPVDVQEGEWEFNVTSEISGMAMQMPPMTYKQCITGNDPVPESAQPGQECETRDVNVSGNKVTWTIHCKSPEGEITGRGRATYEKQSMQGTMTLNVQGMEMINSYKGRRVGPCP